MQRHELDKLIFVSEKLSFNLSNDKGQYPKCDSGESPSTIRLLERRNFWLRRARSDDILIKWSLGHNSFTTEYVWLDNLRRTNVSSTVAIVSHEDHQYYFHAACFQQSTFCDRQIFWLWRSLLHDAAWNCSWPANIHREGRAGRVWRSASLSVGVEKSRCEEVAQYRPCWRTGIPTRNSSIR